MPTKREREEEKLKARDRVGRVLDIYRSNGANLGLGVGEEQSELVDFKTIIVLALRFQILKTSTLSKKKIYAYFQID